ncbi:MAG TPA: FAD-binding oxidoreductase [Caulobacteraceae bacterium]
MALTPRLDLRGGRDCWQDDPKSLPQADGRPETRVDLAIVGAGISGAMIAERFTEIGASVVVIDRRLPVTGSTAASTALVLWAPDVPFVEHVERYGQDGARARWHAVFDAVERLGRRVDRLRLDCGWTARPDLYLAGKRLDARALEHEGEARWAAGLPTRRLGAGEVEDEFGVRAEGALVSEGAYQADPVALARSLLRQAQRQGATLLYPVDVVALVEVDHQVTLELDDGSKIRASRVVIATGYEVEGEIPPGFLLGSSYAFATPPGELAAWRQGAIIWEASDPYLYLRSTADGRIIVGGEDEDFADPKRRDALIPAKVRRLVDKARSRLPAVDFHIDCAWAATFGSSEDGLPAVGLRRGKTRIFSAHAFGGNGIAFAALAADILVRAVDGAPAATDGFFDPDRFR